MGRLNGKVAFITGGARGQGAAIARRFAGEGADIVIADICGQIDSVRYEMSRPADLESIKSEIEGLGRECLAEVADVRDQGQLDDVVAKAVDRFGHIDVVCANAGIQSMAPFWEMTESTWNDMIAVNLSGVWHTAKAVAPTLIRQKSGAMVLTSSINGHEAFADYAHYVAAKAGVLGLTKSFALELGAHGVRVNSILPGPINSPMLNNDVNNAWVAGFEGATGTDMLEATRAWHLLRGAVALPVEAIANAALFLASEDAAHITGLELVVDAGHMLLPGFNHEPVRESEAVPVGAAAGEL